MTADSWLNVIDPLQKMGAIEYRPPRGAGVSVTAFSPLSPWPAKFWD
jgi:hypothetical protein